MLFVNRSFSLVSKGKGIVSVVEKDKGGTARSIVDSILLVGFD